ncbi:hypothetical protein [Patulibacter minatonensis]|uniref:hypothetical protein n=1 Tax=Patulibacter minatonensis TaxID=298163 RepID=UPI0004AF6C43|nr:hypothetical protein [Patulibacter minatonensis]
MTRRFAIPLALLATLAISPAAASADRHHRGHGGPWGGGASATTVAEIDTDDPTGGAGADEVPTTVPAPSTPGGDSGVGQTVPGSGTGRGPSGSGTGAPGTDGGGPGTTGTTDPSVLVPVPSSRRTVRGKVARIRTDGRAAIPRSAPKAVKRVLAAANLIVGKPYKWGGGHARLFDKGYDCSGAVGYALIRAGLLQGSMVSGTFARWASAGAGRWISIHANDGHVYMEVAGLRLDTSAVGDPAGGSGVRWRPVIGRRTGFHTRHLVGL